jgi:glycosyltransferase involved in cell wall biosynthesis
MNASPLVSVVIPAFNSARTLEESVASVLSQTVNDLEVLIVDDGSLDDTLKLAQAIERRVPATVRVLRHAGGANRGVAASRNLALDHARGEYIAFLDADDLWLPTKLERQLEAFAGASPQVGLVCCDVWNIHAEPGTDWETAERWRPLSNSNFKGADGTSAELMLFHPKTAFYNWIASPTPLVRAKYFRDGLRFIGPPRLQTQFEDYLLWLMLSLRCEFLAIPEPLAYYRVHDSQFVSRYARTARCLDYLADIDELLNILLHECRDEFSKRGWEARIWDRFREIALRMVRLDVTRASSRISSIPISDVIGLLRLAIRYQSFKAMVAALAARSCRLSVRRLFSNRLTRVLRQLAGTSSNG